MNHICKKDVVPTNIGVYIALQCTGANLSNLLITLSKFTVFCYSYFPEFIKINFQNWIPINHVL